jgi:hypothetical protein
MSTPTDKLRKPRIKVNICTIQEENKNVMYYNLLCNINSVTVLKVIVSPFLAQEVTNRKAKTYT